MKRLLTKRFWFTNVFGNEVDKGINIAMSVFLIIMVVAL